MRKRGCLFSLVAVIRVSRGKTGETHTWPQIEFSQMPLEKLIYFVRVCAVFARCRNPWGDSLHQNLLHAGCV